MAFQDKNAAETVRTNTGVDMMRELNNAEQVMKDLFRNKAWDLTDGYADSDVKEIVRKRLEKVFPEIVSILDEIELPEDSFFSQDHDAAVLRHLRYLPPFLHSHQFFELVYVKDGKCTNYICSGTADLVKGDICIIPPGTKHALWAGDDSDDLLNILIRSSTFSDVFSSLLSGRDVLSVFFSHALLSGADSSYLIFHTGDDDHIRQFFGFVEEESVNEYRYKSRMLNVLLNTLLIVLLRHHDDHISFAPDNGQPVSDEILEMIHYIQSNCADLTLAMLADHFGYSERHTSRLIRNYTGMSFSDFTRDLRLRRAAEMLQNTALPVASIAEAAGYTDLSSLHRAFRKKYGMTPVQYRRQRP